MRFPRQDHAREFRKSQRRNRSSSFGFPTVHDGKKCVAFKGFRYSGAISCCAPSPRWWALLCSPWMATHQGSPSGRQKTPSKKFKKMHGTAFSRASIFGGVVDTGANSNVTRRPDGATEERRGRSSQKMACLEPYCAGAREHYALCGRRRTGCQRLSDRMRSAAAAVAAARLAAHCLSASQAAGSPGRHRGFRP